MKDEKTFVIVSMDQYSELKKAVPTLKNTA